MTLATLSTPDMLVNYGIWPEVKGWDELQRMPRYFEGRNILVKAKVHIQPKQKNYMTFDEEAKEKHVTHNAVLKGISADRKKFLVQVDGSEEL